MVLPFYYLLCVLLIESGFALRCYQCIDCKSPIYPKECVNPYSSKIVENIVKSEEMNKTSSRIWDKRLDEGESNWITFCLKTVTRLGEEETQISRECAFEVNVKQGCKKIASYQTICYCDKDLCNGATLYRLNPWISIIFVITLRILLSMLFE